MLTEQLDWEKTDGMMPAIVQHAVSGEVLMHGYMNKEALEKTEATGKVTFYSRTKQRLWTKGETSGHVLNVVSITPDCDNDTLLVLVNPIGVGCKHLFKTTTRVFAIATGGFIVMPELIHRLHQRLTVIRRDHAAIHFVLVNERGPGADLAGDQWPGEARAF